VIWQTAINGVLRGTVILKNKDDPLSLKIIGDRHPMALNEEKISAFIDRMPEVPEFVRDTHISVFDVTSRVEQETAKNDKRMPPSLPGGGTVTQLRQN